MHYNKKESILISKICEQLNRSIPSPFLDKREQELIKPILKKINISYQIMEFYNDCDKVIYYKERPPKVNCFKIISNQPLTHREILGSLFGLNITNEVFGDIIIKEAPYILLLDSITTYVKEQLRTIGKQKIKLEQVPLEEIKDYKRKYSHLECNVSSNRIDAVIAKITPIKRTEIKEHIRKKEIILNYQPLTNGSYFLKEGDVFSIRGHGKYQFQGIIKNTKKDRSIVSLKKYE